MKVGERVGALDRISAPRTSMEPPETQAENSRLGQRGSGGGFRAG